VLAIMFGTLSAIVLFFSGRIRLYWARLRRKNREQSEEDEEEMEENSEDVASES
jgi:hypothetical protein